MVHRLVRALQLSFGCPFLYLGIAPINLPLLIFGHNPLKVNMVRIFAEARVLTASTAQVSSEAESACTGELTAVRATPTGLRTDGKKSGLYHFHSSDSSSHFIPQSFLVF